MVQRLTYKRRHAYNTPSNKVKIIKTPGGKLTYKYIGKKASVPKCGDCGMKLQGIPGLRPKEYRTTKKRERTIARAYGGSRCAHCVRERILRAFLVEEQKIVKQVLRQRKPVKEVAKEVKKDTKKKTTGKKDAKKDSKKDSKKKETTTKKDSTKKSDKGAKTAKAGKTDSKKKSN